ncbi:MAG: hypothetical protein ACFFAS_01560 [Promethearchaeota archaeon]
MKRVILLKKTKLKSTSRIKGKKSCIGAFLTCSLLLTAIFVHNAFISINLNATKSINIKRFET